jgi:hypothetical protein
VSVTKTHAVVCKHCLYISYPMTEDRAKATVGRLLQKYLDGDDRTCVHAQVLPIEEAEELFRSSLFDEEEEW